MTPPRSIRAVLRDRTQWHLSANGAVVAWVAGLLVIPRPRSDIARAGRSLALIILTVATGYALAV